jgi:hydroxymethylbilane synthase
VKIGAAVAATLRIGTRGSQLALYQARTVAALLAERAGVTCDIVVVKTSGDRLAEAPLSQIGGKRLFVKEIEDALLARDVDLAVHSSKDMPAVLPEGLRIAAVLPREDPRDAVVLPREGPVPFETLVQRLGREPRIGTSSIRRSAQLTRLFPGARFLPVRGNLDTRLRKLDAGDYDALVLAAAGLKRLNADFRISTLLPLEGCVPAPGQGIIAVETRIGDSPAAQAAAAIDDRESSIALRAERAVVTRLGGGCQMPIGASAAVSSTGVAVTAVVISIDGSRVARADASGSTADPESVGTAAAETLLARGADEILAAVQRAHASVEGLQP